MKKVIILLSTYNGEKYLDQQLESLSNQTYKNLSVFVRDDGSVDSTQAILTKWRNMSALNWVQGGNLGVVKSFFYLADHAEPADYYAFCDQDDVWDNDKTAAAVDLLNKYPQNKPLLYCSAVRFVDQNLVPFKNQNDADYKCRNGFGHSFISNIATGCTCVFNKTALDLIKQKRPQLIYMHDWFLYQFVSAFGTVIFDPHPRISYRQHQNNVIGGGKGFIGRNSDRIKRQLDKSKKSIRLKAAKDFYFTYKNDLNPDKKSILEKFIHYNESLENRVSILSDKRFFMVKKTDQPILKLLFLLGRI